VPADTAVQSLCVKEKHVVFVKASYVLRGRMTAKEGPSSFTLVPANISWCFVRLDLKSCCTKLVAIGNAQNVDKYIC
jgi:hypothetical protein